MTDAKPEDIRKRTFRFACDVVRLCRGLSTTPGVSRQLGGQLLRAGTSIGANLEEAKAAYSKREFTLKNAIALKEAREALYWLRVIRVSCGPESSQIDQLVNEADQLIAILTVIVRRCRSAPA